MLGTTTPRALIVIVHWYWSVFSKNLFVVYLTHMTWCHMMAMVQFNSGEHKSGEHTEMQNWPLSASGCGVVNLWELHLGNWTKEVYHKAHKVIAHKNFQSGPFCNANSEWAPLCELIMLVPRRHRTVLTIWSNHRDFDAKDKLSRINSY